MSRRSEPLLRWLRERLDARGENTASLALRLDRPRAEVRRLLTGAVPMTVDDLLAISEALEVTPAELGVVDPGPEAPAVAPSARPSVHWDSQPEALVRLAFDAGIDVILLCDPAALDGVWGGPEAVLATYRDRDVPLALDAAYHRHMDPSYDRVGVTLLLSFDTLYRCVIPWHAIRRAVFAPLQPEPPAEEPPRLRLVT